MHRTLGLLTLLAVCASPVRAQPVTRGPAECAALQTLQLSDVTLSEISSQWVPAGPAPAPFTGTIPAHCRLEATINRRTGADGQAYGIGVALALPAAWNGRLLFQGGGGFNGVLRYPIGAGAAGDTSALGRGFAVVSTDSGHRAAGGNAFDTAFMADQQALIDFAYGAVERVTAVAKTIIGRHYAQPISRSYYVGCSTGGREAMVAAQRYPLEFDGVIAGAPAMRTYHSVVGVDWVNVQLNSFAPRDKDGKPVPREALSSTQKQAVIEGIRSACDANDGVRDGLVFNTTACTFDPKTLVCGGTNSGASCLTASQASALERAFAGPRTKEGRQIYSPFAFDTGIADTQGIPGLLHGGLNMSPMSAADPDAAARWADANPPNALTDTFGWTNMTTFANRGGKMILYHGVSDSTFSALDTMDYYTRLGAANGGAEVVQRWSRLFLVPGMGHCGSAPVAMGGSLAASSFDMLTALVNWVERDIPPDAVVAGTNGEPRLTRPLCPYPRYAHYSGQGNSNDASSFACREP